MGLNCYGSCKPTNPYLLAMSQHYPWQFDPILFCSSVLQIFYLPSLLLLSIHLWIQFVDLLSANDVENISKIGVQAK